MRMHYSKDVDAMYIRLREDKIEDSDEVSDGIVMDYDKDGNLVAIEILWVSEKADVSELIIQAFENVSVQAVGAGKE
jgi:uncharacterized protein YuzE